MNHIRLTCGCMLVALAASAELPPKGRARLSKGRLTISAGSYRADFSEKAAWTLREVFCADKPMLVATGAQQSVVNARRSGSKDPWIGTAHGREVVESIELLCDGKGYPVKEGIAVSGDEFTLRKRSRLGPYAHTARVTVSAAGITEAFDYEVVEDGSKVNFMYVFMHCFPNETAEWIACLKDGSEMRGRFRDDNSFSLHKVVRWLAVYSPKTQLVIVYVYPKAYEAKGSDGNKFWNRPRDNKLYFQVIPAKGLGAKFSYSVRLKAFEAAEGDWERRAKEAVQAEWPAGDVPEGGGRAP